MGTPESENHTFRIVLCVCYQRNSETNYNRNIHLVVSLLYRIQTLPEHFYNDCTKTLCTGAHKRILKRMWMEFISNACCYILKLQ